MSRRLPSRCRALRQRPRRRTPAPGTHFCVRSAHRRRPRPKFLHLTTRNGPCRTQSRDIGPRAGIFRPFHVGRPAIFLLTRNCRSPFSRRVPQGMTFPRSRITPHPLRGHLMESLGLRFHGVPFHRNRFSILHDLRHFPSFLRSRRANVPRQVSPVSAPPPHGICGNRSCVSGPSRIGWCFSGLSGYRSGKLRSRVRFCSHRSFLRRGPHRCASPPPAPAGRLRLCLRCPPHFFACRSRAFAPIGTASLRGMSTCRLLRIGGSPTL